MSKNILFINKKVLVARTELHSNVAEKLITPTIKRVQDMYLMPLLGSTLFDKLQTLIETYPVEGTMPASDYKFLLDEFIIDMMCNYCMGELASKLNYQFWNTGVATKRAENSDNANAENIYAIKASYTKAGEHYAERLRRYLIEYASSKYPEYYASISGIDKVSPNNQTFQLPIYMGSRRYYEKRNPGDNLPDTRFD